MGTPRAVPVPSGVLVPDRLVLELARVVTIGCREVATIDGGVTQAMAELQHALNVRAAEFRAWAVRQVAGAPVDAQGSGSPGTALAFPPEPRAASAHEPERWLSTGTAARRLGLSTGLLRRWARSGHEACRQGAQGYEWDLRWVSAQPVRRHA